MASCLVIAELIKNACVIKDELIIQSYIDSYMETLNSFLRNQCDKKGVMYNSSVLSREEQAGLDELKDGIDNHEWMVYTTDKSGKIVLDTKENFLQCMQEHIKDDKVVEPDDVRAAEKLINDRVRSVIKVFNIGSESGSGQKRRCGRALVNNYTTIPALQGLRKDHKGDIDNDPTKGPKLRPLCAANRAPNASLGNIMAQVLKAVGDNLCDKVGGEVISSEHLKREFEEANTRIRQNWDEDVELARKHRERRRSNMPSQLQEMDKLCVFSMDIVALYPSIRKDMAVEAVRKAISTSTVDFENIDVTTLVRHVAMTQSRKVLKDLKLLDVVPVPKSTTTFKSFITPRGTARDTDGNSQFTAPKRIPTVNKVKKLIGLVCADATYTSMNNPFYTTGCEVRLQSEGGSGVWIV